MARKYGDDSGGIMHTKPLDEIVKKLDIPQAVMENAILAIGKRVEALAAELCPVDIGNLRDSIQVSQWAFSKGNTAQTYVVADSEYAAYVELGTGIHGPKHQRITPRVKKFLAWQDKSGKWIFARSVQGMKPRPFLAPAVFETKEHLGAIAGDVVKKWLKSLKEQK